MTQALCRTAKYMVEVFWSDDDDGYIAIVPDLPGCSAYHSTDRALAVSEVEDAMDAWLDAARSAGNPIPTPTLSRFLFKD